MTEKTRKLTFLAMMSALSAVLMFISFSVPFAPSYLKMDFSEFPALVAAVTVGPMSGVVVCFVKNLINLTMTQTAGIGELSNFLLGTMFVVPAGLISKKICSIKGYIIGSIVGAVAMAIASVPINYFIVYPVYTVFMPMEVIIGMYKAINSKADTLLKGLLMFNLPFTFVKAALSAIIFISFKKPLEALIKGKQNK